MTGRVRLLWEGGEGGWRRGGVPLKARYARPGPSPELEWLNRRQLSYLGGGTTVPRFLLRTLSILPSPRRAPPPPQLPTRPPPPALPDSVPPAPSRVLDQFIGAARRQDINLNEAARPVSYQL